MPSLFRRKSDDLVADSVTTVTGASTEVSQQRSKGYTPSKKELGVATPKRAEAERRRPVEAPPTNRREALARMREKRAAERAEATEGMKRGDDKFVMARDRGPERALVRDIVDRRRTAGTWFFGGAMIVLIGSIQSMPPVVQLAANLLWVLLAVAVVVDSFFIYRQIGRLVRERFPKTDQGMGGLGFYGIMRALTFRRMRMPRPRVALGAKI